MMRNRVHSLGWWHLTCGVIPGASTDLVLTLGAEAFKAWDHEANALQVATGALCLLTNAHEGSVSTIRVTD